MHFNRCIKSERFCALRLRWIGWAILALAFFAHGTAGGQIFINEVSPANAAHTSDSLGHYDDWIEIYNAGPLSVNLAGRYVSNDPLNPTKYKIPGTAPTQTAIPVGGYLLLWADAMTSEGPTHLSFALNKDGDSFLLCALDGVTLIDSISFGKLPYDVSYGRETDGAPAWRYFSPPTAGRANTGGLIGMVADTQFSHHRGFYNAPFDVAITCATPGSLIYYTTNGGDPTPASGVLYAGPVRTTGTTCLRARAFLSGWLPSNIDTQTYLFLDQVKTQTRPADYPTTWAGPTQADYDMDPEIVTSATYADKITSAFLQIPTLSIVTPKNNLFDPATGIYMNTLGEGVAWERPASAEMFAGDGSMDVQIDCGLRIQGGAARNPGSSPKHSFRLLFKSKYGAAKLVYPLFDEVTSPPFQGTRPTNEFDTIVLRSGYNNSWIHSFDPPQRVRAEYVRDQWNRDVQNAMDRPSAHGRFIHLYLNGMYWGLYNVTERPDAAFASSYFGGEKEEWDALNSSLPVDGDKAAWTAAQTIAQAGVSTSSGYNALAQYVDYANLADFIILNFYGGNQDWDDHNWYSARRRLAGETFKFFAWDSERTLEDQWGHDITTRMQFDKPSYLHQRLALNAEYKMLFADRVHKHFFNGGVFYIDPVNPAWDPAHPERNCPAAFYAQRMMQLDLAVICESARWGDYRRDTRPATPPAYLYTKDDFWTSEVKRLLTEYFPIRTPVVLGFIKARGLYPNVAAPIFTPHGGVVARSSAVTMTATSGSIYYTLDGSDPRLVGGALNPLAVRYNAATPPTLTVRGTIKARARSGGVWSALNEAFYEVQINPGDLIITEILADARGDDANKEWFEIFNTTDYSIDINGLTIADNGTDRHTIAAPGRLYVASKGYLVLGVTTDTSLNGGAPVNYGYGADVTLGNGGDEIALLQGASVIHSVGYGIYTTGTYPIVTSLSASPHQGAAFGMAENYWSGPVNFWMDQYSSFGTNGDTGTPGRANDGVYVGPGSDSSAPNLLEGRFTRADRIALMFDEALSTPTATLAANYAVVGVGAPLTATMLDDVRVELQFASPFAYDAWYCVNVTGVADRLGNAIVGTTSVLVQLTLPPLTITELMYNPPAGSVFEFIELFNRGDTTINLDGMAFTDGVSYTFAAGTTLDPGEYLLAAQSDPAGGYTAFRAHYGLGPSVKIVGPYSGSLSNGGEALTLRTSSWGSPIFAFEYSDGRGWPAAADGGGHSLVPVPGAQAGVSSGSLYYGGNWRASAYIGGSPGGPDPNPPVDIMLNEFAAHTDYMDPPYDSNDWIEIYNPTTAPITLTNYYLSDDVTSLAKWRIPDGTFVPALGWIVLDEINDFHCPITEGFGLNKAGEDLALSRLAGGAGDRIVDCVQFKGQENGVTLGRYPEGGAYWSAMPPTTGTTNVAPHPDLVISEIMYHPPDEVNEFIELRNPTSSPINLFNAVGGWRINGGASYTFPTTATLPAGAYCLVVPFNPGDAAALAAFKAAYSFMSQASSLFGPYTGVLSNRVDRVALERAQQPDPPEVSPSYVIVDEVIYFEQWPFPPEADGAGLSLHRVACGAHGCDPKNWVAALPTPGTSSLSTPSIQSTTSTAITTASAILGGEVLDTGGQDPRVTVYWGSSDGGTSPSAWTWSVDAGIQSGAFSLPVSGLSENTIYYYRCYAENIIGGSWAPASIAFRTLAVHTLTVFVTSGTIHLTPSASHYDHGTDVQLYAEASSGCLFAHWTGDVPPGHETDNPLIITMDADKALTAVIAAIIPSIHPPSIRSTTSTAITTASAILGGEVTDTGGEIPQMTMYWGVSDGGTDPLAWSQSANAGLQSGAFGFPISGLSAATIYYYRCYAQNAGGAAWTTSSASFRTVASYTLTVHVTSGTVRLTPPSGRYDAGTTVSLQAEPWWGCLFLRWSGDVPAGHETDDPLTLTMDSDKATTAILTPGYKSSRVSHWRLY
ncbi:MAG: lamin tail domain-containing protein [Candidatus Sumerlaeota bacterium]|nr:lamin tail domain-containing protein [Candidatus Sumerlaeota bacterium]